jgi:hypothetical protein
VSPDVEAGVPLRAPLAAGRSAETPGVVPREGVANSEPSTASTQPPRPEGYHILKGPFAHGACGRWWTGADRGHCGQCHETFSRGAFDAHQRISGGVITCSTDALEGHEEPWGTLWKLPDDGYWTTPDGLANPRPGGAPS